MHGSGWDIKITFMKNTPVFSIFIYVVFNIFLLTTAYAQQSDDLDHYDKYECCSYLERNYTPGRCQIFELTNELCKTINEISDQYVVEAREKLLSELRDAKHKWELNDINKYEMVMGYQTAWYQEEITIRVNRGSGELIRLVCSAKEPRKSCVLLKKSSTTITSLFNDVKAQIDKLTYNDLLKIVYDDKYGYPKSITTDRKGMNDGWVSYRIKQFDLLEF